MLHSIFVVVGHLRDVVITPSLLTGLASYGWKFLLLLSFRLFWICRHCNRCLDLCYHAQHWASVIPSTQTLRAYQDMIKEMSADPVEEALWSVNLHTTWWSVKTILMVDADDTQHCGFWSGTATSAGSPHTTATPSGRLPRDGPFLNYNSPKITFQNVNPCSSDRSFVSQRGSFGDAFLRAFDNYNFLRSLVYLELEFTSTQPAEQTSTLSVMRPTGKWLLAHVPRGKGVARAADKLGKNQVSHFLIDLRA